MEKDSQNSRIRTGSFDEEKFVGDTALALVAIAKQLSNQQDSRQKSFLDSGDIYGRHGLGVEAQKQ